MSIAAVYALLFIWLFYKWGPHYLFNDPSISKKFILFLYVLKLLAIPAFYLVYVKLYGGLAQFDTGKYFSDARIISQSDLSFFVRCLLGLQNDTVGSDDYTRYLQYTQNWDNGTVKDYLYNDNRVVIRLHALLDLAARGSYFAHAVFSCTLSFVGIGLLYQSFQNNWSDRKHLILLCLVCFPALWFYTGALLKEGIVVFVMGASAYSLKTIINRNPRPGQVITALLSLYLSVLLKPYLLLSFFMLCVIYFFGLRYRSFKKQLIFVSVSAVVFILGAEILSRALKHRSLYTAAMQHQQRFEALGRGGLFMTDGSRYMQLPPDTTVLKKHPLNPKLYTIAKGTAYMYWEPNQANDTLYARIENDTAKYFQKLYFIAPAGSTLYLDKRSIPMMFLSAFYNTTMTPLFLHASGALQLLASFENLVLLVSLVIVVFNCRKASINRYWLLLFCTFAIAMFVFVGLTAPNSGAIFRYRAPIAVFLPIAALMVLTKKDKEIGPIK